MTKLVVFGSMDPLLDNLQALKEIGVRPVMVVLPNDRDTAREQDWLRAHDYDFYISKGINEDVETLETFNADVIFCYAYPEILRQPVIDVPKIGVVNFHTSKLPAYRGRHPVNWAMIKGEKTIGITAHFIDKVIDNGDIILQNEVTVERDDTIGDVLDKITCKTRKMSQIVFRQIASETYARFAQDPSLATYDRPRTQEDGLLDWNKTTLEIHRLINALASPYPNAFCVRGDAKVMFSQSFIGSQPGEVISKTTDGRYVVATKDGIALVTTSTPLEIGDKLGE